MFSFQKEGVKNKSRVMEHVNRLKVYIKLFSGYYKSLQMHYWLNQVITRQPNNEEILAEKRQTTSWSFRSVAPKLQTKFLYCGCRK